MSHYIIVSGASQYYIAEQTRDAWLYRLLPMQFDEWALAKSVAALFEEHGAWSKAWPTMMTGADIGLAE